VLGWILKPGYDRNLDLLNKTLDDMLAKIEPLQVAEQSLFKSPIDLLGVGTPKEQLREFFEDFTKSDYECI
jgi:hypothetical protein